MRILDRHLSAGLWLTLERAARLAPAESKVEVDHVLAAMIECVPEVPRLAPKMTAATKLLWEAGIRWDRATRHRLGIIRPEERAEAAERAELARLKAKYEGGAA